MSLLQLDFNLIKPRNFISSSYIVDAPTELSKPIVMATVVDLFKSSSFWTITNLDITGSNYEAVVVKPNSPGDGVDMRVILTMNASGTNAWSDRDENTPISAGEGHLQIGICPHAANYTNGHYFDGTPFGTGSRWSRYWSAGDYNTSMDFQKLALIESQETFCILSLTNVSPTNVGYVGAIGLAFNSGSGEQDRRMYGMMTVGDTGGIETTFNSSAGGFTDHNVGNYANHIGFFIVSGGIPNGPVGNGNVSNIFEHLDRSYEIASTAIISNTVLGYRTTEGTYLFEPYMYHSDFSNQRAVGMLRQVYMTNDEFVNLTTLASSSDDGNTGAVGIVLSNSFITGNESLIFCNFKENQ